MSKASYFPRRLFDAGFTDLVSVIPPDGQLAPLSKIADGMRGKVPGRQNRNGLWGGYDWRKAQHTAEEVDRWYQQRANVGLRANRFPAVDVDCSDPALSRLIVAATRQMLGPAPLRTGRAPKALLMYRTDEPFGRMRLWVRTPSDEQHLIEVLGDGQQYVVHGIHPHTLRPFEWEVDPSTVALVRITRERADAFLTRLQGDLTALGHVCEREGDGKPLAARSASQEGFRAPSLDALAAAVEATPNNNDCFPSRADYLRMGYAIRAAWPDEEDAAFAVFADWAARWEGNDRADGNDPDVVLADWRRMRPPFSVGWPWIAEQARAFGFNDAAVDFGAGDCEQQERETPEDSEHNRAVRLSEQWLEQQVVGARGNDIRYVPLQGRYLVWNGWRWQPDAELLAEALVKDELRNIAARVVREGATLAEKKAAEKSARIIESANTAASVRRLLQSNRSIAVDAAKLDADPWLLNTPGGSVNLRTGVIRPARPDDLATRATTVAPSKEVPHRWIDFLGEATQGDADLMGYLQRLAGYCLTGVTYEQHLTFLWGPGGNGKGVFMNVLLGVLGDYSRTAAMDTFTANAQSKHPTELAMLAGARLVTASETESGKRWAESRVKAMTGGDPITAHFMRQDDFTYLPQFKLIFAGNHKPEMRSVDDALRRRIHLVPFVNRPAVVDGELGTKLMREYPAILNWMIEGCLLWQRQGLAAPALVRAATDEYFADEDAVGRWLSERTEAANHTESTAALYGSWREWANATGEFVGTRRRLTQALVTRGLPRETHPATREPGFSGLRLLPAPTDFEAMP